MPPRPAGIRLTTGGQLIGNGLNSTCSTSLVCYTIFKLITGIRWGVMYIQKAYAGVQFLVVGQKQRFIQVRLSE